MVGKFLDGLRELVRKDRREVCLVAGVDLAHVGRQFGDREPDHAKIFSNGWRAKIVVWSSDSRLSMRRDFFTRLPRIRINDGSADSRRSIR